MYNQLSNIDFEDLIVVFIRYTGSESTPLRSPIPLTEVLHHVRRVLEGAISRGEFSKVILKKWSLGHEIVLLGSVFIDCVHEVLIIVDRFIPGSIGLFHHKLG